jgi:hypothetical protein
MLTAKQQASSQEAPSSWGASGSVSASSWEQHASATGSQDGCSRYPWKLTELVTTTSRATSSEPSRAMFEEDLTGVA